MAESSAIRLMRIVRNESYHRSWVKLNRALRHAMDVALSSLEFGPDDYGFIRDRVCGEHLPEPGPHEDHAAAVLAGNKTAADSIDRYLRRKAWRVGKHFDGFDQKRGALPGVLYVGATFYHDELWWKVTKFVDDDTLSAVAKEWDGMEFKVRRRRTMTRPEFALKKRAGVIGCAP